MGNLESLRIDKPPQCQIIGAVLVQNCQTCDKSATGPLAWRRWHFCLPPKTHDWPIQGINCFLISWHFWPRGGTTPPSSKGVVVEVGDACCENNPGENVLKKSYKDDPAILEIKQYLVGLLQTLELIRVWKLYGLSLPNTPTDTCRHIRPKSLHSPQKISPDEICG